MSGDHSMGMTFFNGTLYIARDSDIHSRYGTFMHECMHFSLFLMYGNYAKPYCRGDKKRKEKWREVIRKTENQCSESPDQSDDIIKNVFDFYEPQTQIQEVAVRIPHLKARYHDDPEELEQLSSFHKELFEFHSECIMPDFSIPDGFELIKLNKHFGLYEKIEYIRFDLSNEGVRNVFHEKSLIVSNFPQLTLCETFVNNLEKNQEVMIKARIETIFITANLLMELETHNLFNSPSLKRVIIDASGKMKDSLDFTRLKDLVSKREEINFMTILSEGTYSNIEYESVKYSFNDLNEDARSFILQKKVFNEYDSIRLAELINSENEYKINSDILAMFTTEDKNVNISLPDIDKKQCTEKEKALEILNIYLNEKTNKKCGSVIDSSKITTINFPSENFTIENPEKVRILHLKDFLNATSVTSYLKTVDFSKYIQLLLLVVDIKEETKEEIDKLIKFINDWTKTEIFVFEINCLTLNEPILCVGGNKVIIKKEFLLKKLKAYEMSLGNFVAIMRSFTNHILNSNLAFVLRFLGFKDKNVIKEKLREVFFRAVKFKHCLKFLNLFDLNLSPEDSFEILTRAIATKDKEIFLASLDAPLEVDDPAVILEFLRSKMQLRSSENSQTILHVAISYHNVEVVKIIVECIKINKNLLSFDDYQRAIELSYQVENQQIYEIIKLLDSDMSSIYPDERNQIAIFDQKIKQISDLHLNIENADWDFIKQFVNDHSPSKNLKLCIDKDGICALKKSISLQRIKIFSFLRSKGFYSLNYDEIIKDLTEDQKREIFKLNKENAFRDTDHYIGMLLSMCRLNSSSVHIKMSEIRDNLYQLAKDEYLEKLMKFVSYSDVIIYFDFSRDGKEDIRTFDLTNNAWGIAYDDNSIVIGMERDIFHRYATLIHEMAHRAMDLLYGNISLPYHVDDEALRINNYKSIVAEIKAKCTNDPSGNEEIVKLVFDYHESKHLIETIVRVPEMIAYYLLQGKTDSITECRIKYPRLFNYFEVDVCNDLHIQDGFQLRQLNDDFGLIDKLKVQPWRLETKNENDLVNIFKNSRQIYVKSNLPLVTIHTVYKKLQSEIRHPARFKSQVLCIDCLKLESFDNTQKDNFLNLLKSPTVTNLIVDASSVKSFDCKAITESKKDLFMVVSESFKFSEVITCDHHWDHLIIDSKNKIFDTEINFQGIKVPLLDLIRKDILTRLITNEILEEICAANEPFINQSLIHQEKDFIQRTFIETSGSSIEYSVRELVESTLNENVTVFLDVAGSGKTCALKLVRNYINVNHKIHWTTFIELKSIQEVLKTKIITDFETFISQEILKLKKPLEKLIFKHLYSEGRVTLLFDGYDELSSSEARNDIENVDQKNFVELVRLFEKKPGGKIWIATRSLPPSGFLINNIFRRFKTKPLTKTEQVDFLVSFWEKLKVESNKNVSSEKLRLMADSIVQRLSDLLGIKDSGIIGFPLQVYMLADIFKVSVFDGNFEEKLKFKIILIYRWFLDGKSKVFKERIKNTNMGKCGKFLKFMNFYQIHQYFALSYFNPGVENIFGLRHNKKDWSFEKIKQGGLIKFDDANNKFSFDHETFGEHLVAEFVGKEFEMPDEDIQIYKFILKILTDSKYSVVRLFLNDIIAENSEYDEESIKIVANNLSKALDENFAILKLSFEEHRHQLCDYLLKVYDQMEEHIATKVKDSHENFDEIVKIKIIDEEMLEQTSKDNEEEF